jgi:hypothetical protein
MRPMAVGGRTPGALRAARAALRGARAALRAAFLLLPALLPVLPDRAAAQAPGDANAVRLDASYIAGAATYARRVSDDWWLGAGLGAGIDMVRALQSPVRARQHDIGYAEIIHMAGFASWVPSSALRVDLGMRTSAVLYGDSDFSGGVFLGPYITPAVGVRRIKLAPRLQAGYFWIQRESGMALLVQPFVVNVIFPW